MISISTTIKLLWIIWPLLLGWLWWSIIVIVHICWSLVTIRPAIQVFHSVRLLIPVLLSSITTVRSNCWAGSYSHVITSIIITTTPSRLKGVICINKSGWRVVHIVWIEIRLGINLLCRWINVNIDWLLRGRAPLM